MSNQSLSEKFDAVSEMGMLPTELPSIIGNGLADGITLRPYQIEALKRLTFFLNGYPQRQHPSHLLFHMATGSGKTVVMAAAILHLYEQGYRNFLFFVGSSQIVEKTKANFLDAASTKYLFAQPVRVDGQPVEIREVSNFGETDDGHVNIIFTTIQGLHSAFYNPKENAPSFEDLARHKIVMLADEGHHLNALTRASNTLDDQADARDWETMVQQIFRGNRDNLLIEFTATAGLQNEAVAEKYHDKILFDYPLRQFRLDRYSKEIDLREADASVEDRMLQAVMLSHYRRHMAGRHGLSLKPVIMMKSKQIAQSIANEEAFNDLIANLNAAKLETLEKKLTDGDRIGDALRHILTDGLDAGDIADAIRIDFAPEKVRNANGTKDVERQQIELNSLEDRDNEVRVIFAVEKLNEGWDVLNLFDIVRLYDQGSNATTNQEAQLIGRGARYWPFADRNLTDEPRDQRKYDSQIDHPLRCLETLYYHCTHNPAYLAEIKRELIKQGLKDEDSEKAEIRIKPEFRATEFFQKGIVFRNEQRAKDKGKFFSLEAYEVPTIFKLSTGHSGRTSEASAFGDETKQTKGEANKTVTKKPLDFGRALLRHALDSNRFFHFASLKKHFPKLKSIDQFMDDKDYLGGATVEVTGPASTVDDLRAPTSLRLMREMLAQIEAPIRKNAVVFEGTRQFMPSAMAEVVDDRIISVGGPHRTAWSEWKEAGDPDLATANWFAQDELYGTTEELKFVQFIANRIDEFREKHGEIRLIRNEKMVKIFSFDDGRGFEPDFLLYMERDWQGDPAVMQIFVEPKGEVYMAQDQWKEAFLKALETGAELPEMGARVHKLDGLPFFNENDWKAATAFREGVAGYKAQPPFEPLA